MYTSGSDNTLIRKKRREERRQGRMKGKRDEGVGGAKKEEKIGFKIIKHRFESQPFTGALRPQPALPTCFTLSFHMEDAFSVSPAIGTISSMYCRVDSSLPNSRGIIVGANLIMSTQIFTDV